MIHLNLEIPGVVLGFIIGYAMVGFGYTMRLMIRGWRETDWRSPRGRKRF